MKKKDMSLYYNNHLNEISHFENPEIKKQKEEVFKAVVEFDKWYRDKSEGIIKYEGDDYWIVRNYPRKGDTLRPRLLIENVIPSIPECPYISEGLKRKALKNAEKKDPQNLGVMLTENNYGREIQKLTYFQNSDEYMNFHSRGFLYSREFRGDGDDRPYRNIDQEEALFYHLSMIQLQDKNNAVYRIPIAMTNFSMDNKGYLIFALNNDSGVWLIDDMYYISKEELIEVPSDEKGLIDYNQGYPGIEIP